MNSLKRWKVRSRPLRTDWSRKLQTDGLLLATGNAGKIEEFRRIVPARIALTVPANLGLVFDPVEDGLTFEENALIKARALARHGPVLADDSGLCVTALGDRPGVLSARYGGPGLSGRERYELLLSELLGVKDRRARFVCVLVLLIDGQALSFEGSVEGLIAEEPAGATGFGYDPIFYYPPAGRTFAQMSAAEKDAISHRGQAMRKLEAFLRNCA